MIQGFAFMSHQLGSFLGAFGGGLLFDALGSYDLAWRLGVGMGLTACVGQIVAALIRPPQSATTRYAPLRCRDAQPAPTMGLR
jgi:predicted MFS family arabinose efflux permease